ncbi:MAG: hypothetical protein BZ138_07100 [Methanosphaera sp. rholeuAM270]|nr:MAG: hypothetical protein BZ138_07100 [Methanosphaera sp. rholeuAM270]
MGNAIDVMSEDALMDADAKTVKDVLWAGEVPASIRAVHLDFALNELFERVFSGLSRFCARLGLEGDGTELLFDAADRRALPALMCNKMDEDELALLDGGRDAAARRAYAQASALCDIQSVVRDDPSWKPCAALMEKMDEARSIWEDVIDAFYWDDRKAPAYLSEKAADITSRERPAFDADGKLKAWALSELVSAAAEEEGVEPALRALAAGVPYEDIGYQHHSFTW